VTTIGTNFAHVAAVVALLALFPIPGALVAFSGRNPRSLAAWIDALVPGYAASILGLYLTGLRDYRLFGPVWMVATAAAVFFWRRRGRVFEKITDPAEPAEDRYIVRRCLAIVGAAFALRIAPTLWREFPLGWDPYFHLVVAAKIARVHALIHDIQPLDTLPLNYPQGSHVLVALLSGLGAVPLHHVFGIAIAWFGTLCVAQVFALARYLTGDGELSLYAAAAYGLLAILGGLGYYDWGGLPNLIAVYLFLGMLSLLARASDASLRNLLTYAFLYLAICVVHHHAMVVVPAVLIPLAAWQMIFSRDQRGAWLILRGSAAGAVLGLGYFLPYLWRATTVRSTAILGFDEGVSSVNEDLLAIGLAFSCTAIMGVICAICLRRRRPVSEILAGPAIALVVYYAGLKYGIRALIVFTTGRHVSLFTPSRFLTDAVPLLAVFAAIFLVEMRRLLGVSADRVILAIVACFFLNVSFYHRLFRQEISQPYQAAYAWLRRNSTPIAGIIEKRIHGTYMTGRLASEMPMPISEYDSDDSNRARLRAVKEGRLSPAGFGEVYVIEQAGEFAYLTGPVVWSDDSGLHIRRLR
jgi:hypothetical protein